MRNISSLDSGRVHANISSMSHLPSIVPSLARAFEPERHVLRKGLAESDLTAPQIVSEARRALDRVGVAFSAQTPDPQMHKAGLWLLEMVKAGAGVLDQGTGAEIVWHEVPKPPAKPITANTIFYGAVGALALTAWVQQSSLAFLSVIALGAIRLLDPANLSALKSKLPFMKAPPAIEDRSGRQIKAEARVIVDAAGFVDSLSEALRTADHILLRLSEPESETHWREDPRLMSLVQGLLEARTVNDGDFALKLIGAELESILESEGIRRVEYSKRNAKLFDVLPGLGNDTVKPAAPALLIGDEVIRRGTVWGADGE